MILNYTIGIYRNQSVKYCINYMEDIEVIINRIYYSRNEGCSRIKDSGYDDLYLGIF